MDCKRRREPRPKLLTLLTLLALQCSAAGGDVLAQEPARPPVPHRVVSINLCTDQLLLALGTPEQTVAVSYLARSELSYLRIADGSTRVIDSGAESVLALKPDLVLAGAFAQGETRRMLVRQGLRVEAFAPAMSLPEAKDEIDRAARLLAREDAGNRLVAAISSELDDARGAGAGLTAVAYERRGYASAKGTLIDEVLGHLGVRNAASRAGLTSVAAMPLEAVIAARPDVVILDWGGEAPPDQGTALLLHPALARALPQARQIVLPARLVSCGGPALPEMIRTLAAGLRAVRAEPSR